MTPDTPTPPAPSPAQCDDIIPVTYGPSNDAPRSTRPAQCVLPAGHLGSHEGHAHGRRWFWNAHALGILRDFHPTTNQPLVAPNSNAPVLTTQAQDESVAPSVPSGGDSGQLLPSPASAETLRCGGCGDPYSDFPLDVTLPDEQWMAIQGRPGGVLCASCIVERASWLPGAVAVRARIAFASDPHESASAETLEQRLKTEAAIWENLPPPTNGSFTAALLREAADTLRRLQSTEQERDRWKARAETLERQLASCARQLKLDEQEQG